VPAPAAKPEQATMRWLAPLTSDPDGSQPGSQSTAVAEPEAEVTTAAEQIAPPVLGASAAWLLDDVGAGGETPVGSDGDAAAVRRRAVEAYCREFCPPERAAAVVDEVLAATPPEAGTDELLNATRIAAAGAVAQAAALANVAAGCLSTPSLLALRSRGDLDRKRRRDLDRHLEDCLVCRATELRAARAERAFGVVAGPAPHGAAPHGPAPHGAAAGPELGRADQKPAVAGVALAAATGEAPAVAGAAAAGVVAADDTPTPRAEPGPRRRRRRPPVLLGGLAVLLVAGIAAAAIVIGNGSGNSPAATPPSAVKPASSAVKPASTTGAGTPAAGKARHRHAGSAPHAAGRPKNAKRHHPGSKHRHKRAAHKPASSGSGSSAAASATPPPSSTPTPSAPVTPVTPVATPAPTPTPTATPTSSGSSGATLSQSGSGNLGAASAPTSGIGSGKH
jgi:hypothetical protein